IPYLGMLASQVDLPGAAAQVALGQSPAIRTAAPGAAAVRFIYPGRDVRFTAAALRRDACDYPGLRLFHSLADAGQELRLPPRGYLSRLAAVVVGGDSRAQCIARLDAVASDVIVTATPLCLGTVR